MLEEKIYEIENRLKTEAKIVALRDYHLAYHNLCSDQVTIPGMWLEFGVYRGRSICQLANKTTNIVYGFDSFEGLPEFWYGDNQKGSFDLRGIIPEGSIDGENCENPGMFDNSPTRKIKPWPPNVKLIKGWFNDSLPPFLEEHKDQCALIHIDSDLYSSAKTVLALLKDRISDGTIIMFDEINDYPDYKNHEIKAFAEFLIETGLNYKPLIYQNLGCSQGCFKIIK